MSDWRNAVSEQPVSKIGLVKFGKVNEFAEVSVQEVSSSCCILQLLERIL